MELPAGLRGEEETPVSVNYSLAVKNTRLAAVMAAIDAGPGVGVLVIGTLALAGAVGVLATIPLQKPSFTISGGLMTVLGTPLAAYATGSGQAALAELRDSTGAVVATGLTVGLAGTDFIVDYTTVNAGEYVTLTDGAIQHS